MRRLALVLFSTATLLGLASAQAEDIGIVTSADLAHKSGSIDLPVANRGAIKPVFNTLNLTLVATSGNVYLSGSYETPITNSQELNFDAGRVFDDRFTRTDANLALGYRALPWLSVFAGYLKGESELQRVDYLPGFTVDEFFVFRFKESGPFGGLALNHSFGQHGTLSASIAYGFLDGDITFIRNGLELRVPPIDTSGFSYSLLWTGALDTTLSYRVGIKATRYTIEASALDPALSDLKESFTSFVLGITKVF